MTSAFESAALKDLRVLRAQHQPRFAAVDVFVTGGVHHGLGDDTRQFCRLFRVGVHIHRAFGAHDCYRALLGGETALYVQRLPGVLCLVFGAAKGVFGWLSMGGAVHLAWQRATHVLQDEPHRPANSGIRPCPLPKAVQRGIDAEPLNYRPIEDEPHRHRIGGRLDALQIELGIGNRLGRRD